MTRSKSCLKVTALVSSVLLVGAFVSYRAGAFDRILDRNHAPAEAEATPNSESKPATTGEPEMFYSSKTLRFTIPDQKTAPKAAAKDKGQYEAIIGGSKSGFIIEPPQQKKSSPSTPAPKPTP